MTVRALFDLAPGKASLPRFFLTLLTILSTVSFHSHALPLAQSASAKGSAISVRVPDVELVDQNGQHVHLYSDLIQGRHAIVINTFFTTCTTICPLIGIRMDHLQQSLGPCKAKEYSLVSISVDPQTDTPERMREWANKFHAGPCWTLLTGPKTRVDAALKALHLFTPDKNSHTLSALIGGVDPDGWKLVDINASQDILLKILRAKMNASTPQRGTK